MQTRTAVVALVILLLAGSVLLGAAVQVAHPAAAAMPLASVNAGINPQEIINIDSANLDPTSFSSVPVPAGGELTLFTVPAGRWFVMTNFQGGGQDLELAEVSGSVTTVKRGYVFNSGSPSFSGFVSAIGLVFAPGSRVVLRNVSPSQTDYAYFTLTGFLLHP